MNYLEKILVVTMIEGQYLHYSVSIEFTEIDFLNEVLKR